VDVPSVCKGVFEGFISQAPIQNSKGLGTDFPQRLPGRSGDASRSDEIRRRRTPVAQATNGQARLSISWTRNERWSEWAALSQGCYLLRTNLTNTDAPTLWKRYTQLSDAEWAFRINKDELEIRPVWHRKQDRVKAHILVCFLAYCLWKNPGSVDARSGLGDAPRTLIEEFAKNLSRLGMAALRLAMPPNPIRIVSKPAPTQYELQIWHQGKTPKGLP
jgi:hypothetical protein